MEKLKHFSHNHRLILNKEHSGAYIVCHGCNQQINIGTLFYSCTRPLGIKESCDNFFLHQTCADLPKTLQHPTHPVHPLTLNSCRRSSVSWYCFGCRANDLKLFRYTCNECQFFNVCLACLFAEGMLQLRHVEDNEFWHDGHGQHTLTLRHTRALSECNACGTQQKDLFYTCNSCQFLIHQSCARLPPTTTSRAHCHPLVLAFTLPEGYRLFRQFCGICNDRVFPKRWLYYCADCRFFAHLRCVVSFKEPSFLARSSETTNDQAVFVESKLVHFPLTSESSILKLLMKDSSRDDTATIPAQINHWSHKDHPLDLLNELENGSNDNLLCDGCVQPILTAPFYSCTSCRFFLHQFCVKLPSQLPHPSGGNRKLVCGKYTNPSFYVKCDKCKYITNGMFFSCGRGELFLDVKCALLPKTIKHEAHNHPLTRTSSHGSCNACDSRCEMFFICKACKFCLCRSCTFIPHTIRHRWDRHPIRLVYSRIQDHPDAFYCEICEEEINTNYWLYFCSDCDHSFHPKCLYPYYAFSNIKFGVTDIKLDSEHQHSLTFVGMKWHKFGDITCKRCGEIIPDGSPVLECEPCFFRLCANCSPSVQADCLLEACARPNEEPSKLSAFVSNVFSFNNFLFMFSIMFVSWVGYEIVLVLWLLRLYLIFLALLFVCLRFF